MSGSWVFQWMIVKQALPLPTPFLEACLDRKYLPLQGLEVTGWGDTQQGLPLLRGEGEVGMGRRIV